MDAVDYSRRTALMWAALYGLADVVGALIDAGKKKANKRQIIFWLILCASC